MPVSRHDGLHLQMARVNEDHPKKEVCYGIFGLFRRKRNCNHVAELDVVEPGSPDSCLQFAELGDRWVNLRLCLTCGQVGCCDASKNKHATGHHR